MIEFQDGQRVRVAWDEGWYTATIVSVWDDDRDEDDGPPFAIVRCDDDNCEGLHEVPLALLTALVTGSSGRHSAIARRHASQSTEPVSSR